VNLPKKTMTATMFPNNKIGLMLIFTLKFTPGLIFRRRLILIYQKMKLQSKN